MEPKKPTFATGAKLGRLLCFRVSPDQEAYLDRLAEKLSTTKSELTRMALDYWISHSPEAKKATGP